MSQSCNKYQNS